MASPFSASGTATRLDDKRISHKLIIRVDDTTSTDRILFRVSPTGLVDSTHANGFLKAGESLEIDGLTLKSSQDVSIIATSGTPLIYWGEI